MLMFQTLFQDFRAADTLERTGLIGLFLFGLFGPLGPAATLLACLVLLGATLAPQRAAAHGIGRDPVFLVFCVLAAYTLARAGFAAHEFPSIAGEQWNEAADLLYPVFLLPVAWWLRGDPQRVLALLTLALAGFCLDMLIELDWSRLPDFLAGQRNSITGSKLSTALYTGTAILGLVAFAPRITRAILAMRPAGKVVAGLLLCTAVLLLMAAQYITLTRSVVLSLLVLVPLMIAFHWWRHRGTRLSLRARVVCALVAVMLVAIAAVGYERVEQRIEREAQVLTEVAQGDLDDVPLNSLGARVHLWRFGAQLIAERPAFGWGPGTRATRFLAPQRDRDELEIFGDLHNEWLQILFWLGITGLVIYLVLFALLLRAGLRACRAGSMPGDIGLFLLATLLLLGGWSLINGRLLNPDFQYFLMLILGVMYTFDVERRRQREHAPPPSR